MLEFISAYLGISLVVVILLVIIYGAFWLILRPLVLWYFKIYTIVSEMQENNALLREIRDELMKRNIQKPSSPQPKEDHSKYMPR